MGVSLITFTVEIQNASRHFIGPRPIHNGAAGIGLRTGGFSRAHNNLLSFPDIENIMSQKRTSRPYSGIDGQNPTHAVSRVKPVYLHGTKVGLRGPGSDVASFIQNEINVEIT
jgi:hypothetical protein